MAMGLNGFAQVPVRLRVTVAGNPVTNTNQIEVSLKDLLIAAFEAIPSQAGATATVANIVTALKTLP
jgi:hypothetical protein